MIPKRSLLVRFALFIGLVLLESAVLVPFFSISQKPWYWSLMGISAISLAAVTTWLTRNRAWVVSEEQEQPASESFRPETVS